MIRKLIPFLLVASLAACANTGGSRTSSAPASSASSASSSSSTGASYGSSSAMPGSSTGKSCDAGALQSQIGQKATPSVMEDMRTRSGSATARMLRPGQLVTMEYNNTRLNLIVDDKDVMTAIRCG
ncbi:I78 family peptidase inhibitor [Achromobacter spanius]|uniref:I78 family peptidase inhibitor n=1 Tax=Achromobacter spanius TaxID=217203 RepID=UPI003830A2FA